MTGASLGDPAATRGPRPRCVQPARCGLVGDARDDAASAALAAAAEAVVRLTGAELVGPAPGSAAAADPTGGTAPGVGAGVQLPCRSAGLGRGAGRGLDPDAATAGLAPGLPPGVRGGADTRI